MILDTLSNLDKYKSINPLFSKVVDFINSHTLSELPLGKIVIENDDVYVNIVDSPVKNKIDAKLETHKRMIDIQVPITSSECHGWAPLSILSSTEYNDSDDISFYDDAPTNYFNVSPGQFVIYFPQDGHAPAITTTGLRKLIFKVKVL